MYLKYISNDGREFDNEVQCRQYEKESYFETFISSVTQSRFLDACGNRMDTEYFYKYFWRCDYMEVANEEEAKVIHNFFNKTNCISPWNGNDSPKAGRYYWDECDDDSSKWFSLDDIHKKIEYVQEIFERK